MLTKNQNLIYAGQIAGLFCEGAQNIGICLVNILQRIKTGFTDEIFENYFLPLLNTNRFYAFTLVRYEPQGYFKKVVIEGNDMVTGSYTGHLGRDGVPNILIERNNWNEIMSFFGYKYVGKINDKIIVRKTGLNYGIVFIPDTVQPPGNGTGTINVIPEPIPPGFVPGVPPVLVPDVGLDLAKYLVPAGVLVAAFYAYKNL